LTKAQSEKRKVKSAKWKRKAKTQFIKPPVAPDIAHAGRQRAHGAIRPWNYFRRIQIYLNTVPDRYRVYRQTDRQTDGQTKAIS